MKMKKTLTHVTLPPILLNILLVISPLFAEENTGLEIYTNTRNYTSGEVKWTYEAVSPVVWKWDGAPNKLRLTAVEFQSDSFNMPGAYELFKHTNEYGYNFQIGSPPPTATAFVTIGYALYKLTAERLPPESPRKTFIYYETSTCDIIPAPDIWLLYDAADSSMKFFEGGDSTLLDEGDTLYVWERDSDENTGEDHDCMQPTTPTGLEVSANGNYVQLNWNPSEPVFESDIGGARYRIFRKKNSGNWIAVNNIQSSTSYTDIEVTIGGSSTYSYRVRARSLNNLVSPGYTNIVDTTGTLLPAKRAFGNTDGGSSSGKLAIQNYPNPFNPVTTLIFNLPEKSEVELSIYDINGRLIIRNPKKTYSAGTHRIRWDGRNFASGIYFYHIRAGSQVRKGKMVLMK